MSQIRSFPIWYISTKVSSPGHPGHVSGGGGNKAGFDALLRLLIGSSRNNDQVSERRSSWASSSSVEDTSNHSPENPKALASPPETRRLSELVAYTMQQLEALEKKRRRSDGDVMTMTKTAARNDEGEQSRLETLARELLVARLKQSYQGRRPELEQHQKLGRHQQLRRSGRQQQEGQLGSQEEEDPLLAMPTKTTANAKVSILPASSSSDLPKKEKMAVVVLDGGDDRSSGSRADNGNVAFVPSLRIPSPSSQMGHLGQRRGTSSSSEFLPPPPPPQTLLTSARLDFVAEKKKKNERRPSSTTQGHDGWRIWGGAASSGGGGGTTTPSTTTTTSDPKEKKKKPKIHISGPDGKCYLLTSKGKVRAVVPKAECEKSTPGRQILDSSRVGKRGGGGQANAISGIRSQGKPQGQKAASDEAAWMSRALKSLPLVRQLVETLRQQQQLKRQRTEKTTTGLSLS